MIETDYNFVDNLEALGRILYPWAILGATVFGIGFGLDRWTTRQARRERERERTPRELDDERRELEEEERQRHWEQVLHEWELGDKGRERLAEYQRLREDEKQQPEWRDLYESERGGPEPDYRPRKVRIVIADDHVVVRKALRLALDAEPDLEVVAEAGDVDAARRYVRNCNPDVLVLDLDIPGESSLVGVPTIREEAPDTQIVVLTTQEEPAYARYALDWGVLGYVLKEDADDVIRAVRTAATGDSYFNWHMSARDESEPRPGHVDNLSERDVDVLRLMALGYTSRQIAEQLRLSQYTVAIHRWHIYEHPDRFFR